MKVAGLTLCRRGGPCFQTGTSRIRTPLIGVDRAQCRIRLGARDGDLGVRGFLQLQAERGRIGDRSWFAHNACPGLGCHSRRLILAFFLGKRLERLAPQKGISNPAVFQDLDTSRDQVTD